MRNAPKQEALKAAYADFAGTKPPDEVRDTVMRRAGVLATKTWYRILPALRAMHAEAKRDKVSQETPPPVASEPTEFLFSEITIPANIPDDAKACISQYANMTSVLQAQLQQSKTEAVLLREQTVNLARRVAFLKKKVTELVEVM
jgi:hypothetical protein